MSDLNKLHHNHALEARVEEMRLENERVHKEQGHTRSIRRQNSTTSHTSSPRDALSTSKSRSPVKNGHLSELSTPTDSGLEVVGGEVTVSQEPGEPPKLSRTTSQKIRAREAPLYLEVEDRTYEATEHFDIISACNYLNKWIGSTEHGSMDCDCVEEWGKACPTLSIL